MALDVDHLNRFLADFVLLFRAGEHMRYGVELVLHIRFFEHTEHYVYDEQTARTVIQVH